MTYAVKFSALLESSDKLEANAKEISGVINDIETVERQLSRLSDMTAIVTRVRRERENLENQTRIMRVMAQALRRIYQTYLDTENTVADNADCPTVHFSGTGTSTSGFRVMPMKPYYILLNNMGINVGLSE